MKTSKTKNGSRTVWTRNLAVACVACCLIPTAARAQTLVHEDVEVTTGRHSDLYNLYREFEKAQAALRVADAELTSVEERIATERSNVARLEQAFRDKKTLRRVIAAELKAATYRLDKIEKELDGIAKDLESIGVTLRRIGAMAERMNAFRFAQEVKRTMAVLEAIQNRVSQDEDNVDSIREAIRQLLDGIGICLWDLDANGSVDSLDLLRLVAAWDTDPGGPPDFDGDRTVGIFDLLTLLANWGPCA
ncbi:MAG: hypothetical protein IH830_05170 [Planctomycetes bacterium]|nr:hypothetical protein [Planctomycetota bacterium]